HRADSGARGAGLCPRREQGDRVRAQARCDAWWSGSVAGDRRRDLAARRARVTEKITRRQAIKRLGGATCFGAGVVGGALAAQTGGADAAVADGPSGHGPDYPAAPEDRRLSGQLPAGSAAGPYGGEHSPPEWMDGSELDHLTF